MQRHIVIKVYQNESLCQSNSKNNVPDFSLPVAIMILVKKEGTSSLIRL